MLFKNKYKEFVRLFLYKNGLTYIHIQEDVIINKYQCEFSDINRLNISKIKTPIELIVHHRSMNCSSFTTNELSNKDIEKLVHNTIEQHNLINNQVNTIFYYFIKKPHNKKLLQICECDLDKEMLRIFNVISSNPNVSTTVFPIWVTSNFLSMYYNNTYEFTTNVFVSEYLDCWNIIVINDKRIIYNRSGLLNSFNKDIEIPSTLSHIKNKYNINIDDIIIYEFGDDTINSLTKYYKCNMKMISNKQAEITPIKKKPNNIIKIACFSCIGVNCFILLSNMYNIHKLIVEKTANTNYINNCNNDLIIWHNIHNIYYSLQNINYKKTLDNYLTENHTDIMNNLHMQLDCNNNIHCGINV